MADQRLEVVLGAGSIGSNRYPDVESSKQYCEMFRPYGTRIDLARIYPVDAPGKAEEFMKSTSVSNWATMDSKVTAIGNREHSKESIASSIDQSLDALGVKSLDVYYLHMPDSQVPFEASMAAVDREYRNGKFKRLRLSNRSPSQVEELVEIAKKRGCVQPSVYQGHYNPIVRKSETTILPILRRHGTSYIAFSPAGVGIFSRNVTSESIHNPDSRFYSDTPIGKFWSDAYLRPEILEAAKNIREEAETSGIDGHHAALRWIIHHSALRKELSDAIVLSSSTFGQHEGNLAACDAGPLPSNLVRVIDNAWKEVESVAPRAWMGVLSDDLRKEFESKQTQ